MRKMLLTAGMIVVFLVAPFFWDFTYTFVVAQNVGIGTTSPSAKLHVEVQATYTSPIFKVSKVGVSTPYFIIIQDGRVGIGVSSPSEVLDVWGNISFSGSLMPAGNAGTAGQVLVSQGPGAPPQWQNLNGSGNVGDSVCNTVMNNYLQKWIGTKLCNSIIYDDGTNVGIGINVPTATLDINGNLRIRTINNATVPLSSYSILVANNIGEVQQIGFTGNHSDVLRGDGTWGTISGGATICSSPTANIVQKWTGTNLCNSQISDDGTTVMIGGGAPFTDAILQLNSTSQGLLPPRVTLTNTLSPSPMTTASPPAGLLVYNTNTTSGTNGVSPGYYYWDGTMWKSLGGGSYKGIIFGTISSSTTDLVNANATGQGVAGPWESTGSTITLPPGQWIVQIVSLGVPADNGAVYGTPDNCTFWIRNTLRDGTFSRGAWTTGTWFISGDIVGSKYVSGIIPASSIFGTISGFWIVNNTSSSNKTYTVYAQFVMQGGNCTYSNPQLKEYFASYWNENQFIAIPVK